jgi:hypothetical protein
MRSSAAMGQRARRMQSSALPALFAAFSLRVRPSSTVHFSFSTVSVPFSRRVWRARLATAGRARVRFA